MRIWILATAAVALTACHRPAEPAAPAPAAAPVAAGDDWNGKYEGDLRVEITGTPGAYKAMLLTANATCDGDIGLDEDGVPATVISDSEMDVIYKDDDHDTTCKVVLSKAGSTLTVTEDAGCATYHGVSCSFNGTATRVK